MRNIVRTTPFADDAWDDITLVASKSELLEQAAIYDRQRLTEQEATHIRDEISGVFQRLDKLLERVGGKLDTCLGKVDELESNVTMLLDRVVVEDDGEPQ